MRLLFHIKNPLSLKQSAKKRKETWHTCLKIRIWSTKRIGLIHLAVLLETQIGDKVVVNYAN